MAKVNSNANIDEIIKKAVREGIEAGMSLAKKSKQELNPYKLTEKLLYSYHGIKKFIINCQDELDQLVKYGLPEKSNSFVFIPSGSRITGMDMLEAKINDLQYKIQANEKEIEKIDKALDTIRNDEYYSIIELKYLREGQLNDDEIAEQLHCDRSTVCRNRNRLVLKLAIIIHGKDALS